jgi:arylsulfatase B/arylsulfatase I/J
MNKFLSSKDAPAKPNILLLMVDDLGYNDVGYRQNKVTDANPNGSPTTHPLAAVKTPTIDRLASESFKLERHYAHSTCSPSRVAILTGRFPWRTGTGPIPLVDGMPYGLPGAEKLISEVMTDAGYATHMVGKWHLGLADERYTPTFRGFDSFFGMLTGGQDYFTHRTKYETLDFRTSEMSSRNVLPPNTDEFKGKYSATIFAERVTEVVAYHKANGGGKPLFLFMSFQTIHGKWVGATEEAMDTYTGPHFEDADGIRVKTGLAMVTATDTAIASIEKDFIDAGLWDNTVLVFTGDNGGNPMAPGKYGAFGTMWPGGSNYPLRGAKATDWEGGIRCTSFIRGTTAGSWPVNVGETKELTHLTDVFATMAYIAGGSTEGLVLDGKNIYDVISKGAAAERDSIIFDCPYVKKGGNYQDALASPGQFGAIRLGDLKLFYHQLGARSCTDTEVQHLQLKMTNDALLCDCPAPIGGVFVFNVVTDPGECTNLAGDPAYADQIKAMENLLNKCTPEAVEPLTNMYMYNATMKAIWQEQTKKQRVFSDTVGTNEWTQYDCNLDHSGGICGWPTR